MRNAEPSLDGETVFGEVLRQWRRVRRLSQLELAEEVATTQRYVSFLESGRAQPSREMVLRLARVLEVPLRERNQLLLAAGYAPLYRDSGLTDEHAMHVRAAIERMLVGHEPYPAVVMDRHWNVLRTNAAADALFGWLLNGEHEQAAPANVIRLMFDSHGLRPYVANWDAAAEVLIQRVHREAVGGLLDAETRALLDHVLALPDVAGAWRSPDFKSPLLPVIPIVFDKDGLRLSYFSTLTTVGTPQDALLQEIRIESFYAADDVTLSHVWSSADLQPYRLTRTGVG